MGDRRLREWVETVTGQHHFMLTGLQHSSTRTRNYGVQVFRMIEGGLEVDSPEVFFSTNTYGKSSEDSVTSFLPICSLAKYYSIYSHTYM